MPRLRFCPAMSHSDAAVSSSERAHDSCRVLRRKVVSTTDRKSIRRTKGNSN